MLGSPAPKGLPAPWLSLACSSHSAMFNEVSCILSVREKTLKFISYSFLPLAARSCLTSYRERLTRTYGRTYSLRARFKQLFVRKIAAHKYYHACMLIYTLKRVTHAFLTEHSPNLSYYEGRGLFIHYSPPELNYYVRRT